MGLIATAVAGRCGENSPLAARLPEHTSVAKAAVRLDQGRQRSLPETQTVA